MTEYLKPSGIAFFLVVTLIFGAMVAGGSFRGANPEGIPALAVNLPVLFGVMAVGPLSYWFGARVKKKSKANDLTSKTRWRASN